MVTLIPGARLDLGLAALGEWGGGRMEQLFLLFAFCISFVFLF